jgi:hypothetical protein
MRNWTFATASFVAGAIAGSALIGGSTPAAAQWGWHPSPIPFCASFSDRGGGYESCSYYTMEQCRASVSGVGGRCFENPSFVPPDDYRPVRKRKKRY